MKAKMKNYIDGMLNDNELSTEDKNGLLEGWIVKIELSIVEGGIISSEDLRSNAETITYMKSKIDQPSK